jgi:hypothetical protein
MALASTGQDRRLEGWKAIAGALGVAARTAQDYRASRGLPIHRSFRGPWAMLSELRKWEHENGLRASA